MSRLLNDIKNCDECGSKTNELYLTKYSEILCADCEADFIVKESEDE
jgi:DNA-directed RNA polymerase subunit RPC12/RpoP